jgi:hypothetical protein
MAPFAFGLLSARKAKLKWVHCSNFSSLANILFTESLFSYTYNSKILVPVVLRLSNWEWAKAASFIEYF